MLAQYRRIKAEHPDVILMFRLGDFYEMFGEDARVASEILEIALTSRHAGGADRLPMCGVPYAAAERYVARLIASGHRVALCDQIEDARVAKGLVRRAVTRVLSPGTLVEDGMLEARTNNYLVVVCARARADLPESFGIAVADVSTGEFAVTQIDAGGMRALAEEIARLAPAELLLAGDPIEASALAPHVRGRLDALPEDPFRVRSDAEILCEQFGTASLKGFGCEGLPLAIRAAAKLLLYLRLQGESSAAHLRSLSSYSTDDEMPLDASTRRHLDLVQTSTGEGRSLLSVLDRTVTPMGGRMMRRWILRPLLSVERIRARQEAVTQLVDTPVLRAELREALRRVSDLERLTARVCTGACTPRDLGALRASLDAIPDLARAVASDASGPLAARRDDLDALPETADLLRHALVDEAPVHLRDGGAIRSGFSEELDQLRATAAGGKEGIARLEAAERERTGIPNLKVGYNSVFGYYIEITKANLARVPPDYHRKQTTANGERFLTPRLKEYEAEVLGAEDRAVRLEAELFETVRQTVAAESSRLLALARTVAGLDTVAGLAEVASASGYARPDVDSSGLLEIRDGRHPVVETAGTEPFVPNDLLLGTDEQRLLLITGPNMAGKSTYLRQTALIVLMAQIGSFVPAASARVGIVDRIFTRVGAHDDLAGGQSTFMVEMAETANILNNATASSLIVLDEIGRGTSTYDGLSIAWAIAEQIARLGARALFATHYHQLNALEKLAPGVRNFRVLVKEQGHRIVFLRKIAPGGTDRSYGLQVASLAGIPPDVIGRAREVLADLESNARVQKPGSVSERTQRVQLTFFEADVHPVVDALRALDVDTLTPLEALAKLDELQRLVKG